MGYSIHIYIERERVVISEQTSQAAGGTILEVSGELGMHVATTICQDPAMGISEMTWSLAHGYCCFSGKKLMMFALEDILICQKSGKERNE